MSDTRNLEQVLQDINKEYIALRKEEKRRNNRILKDFLEIITEHMKKNKVFKELYRTHFFGGSYYDKLKVGMPDEYDLDFVLELPKLTRPRLHTADSYPGYVTIQLENVREYGRQDYAIHRFTETFLDDNHYLSTRAVLFWMQGIVDTALNQFPERRINTEYGDFQFKRSGSGPATTVLLEGYVDGSFVAISIDLVPCFVFTGQDWPSSPFRECPFEEQNDFFVVPKQPSPTPREAKYWRLSFQEQERSLITRLRHLKPSMRLIKRIRDVWVHKCISSYYIKTIYLWEVEEQDATLWGKPLSHVFLTMLKKYKQALDNSRISYYWNENNNLLEKIDEETLTNFANLIRKIIRDIEMFPEDPSRVIKYFVNPSRVVNRPNTSTVVEDRFNNIIEKVEPRSCVVM